MCSSLSARVLSWALFSSDALCSVSRCSGCSGCLGCLDCSKVGSGSLSGSLGVSLAQEKGQVLALWSTDLHRLHMGGSGQLEAR